ncbi:MAG: ATP-binding protein [Bacteroidales bacterium]|nr:ATP-binding protein [Bacteroidales bacterium]
MSDNPFILEPYRSKDLFCDRENELAQLMAHLENGRNVTMISPRRLGKTGLIFRLFDEIKTTGAPYETVYADISDTLSLEDFIKVLSQAVATQLKSQSKILSFLKALKSIRPLLGVDPFSGMPQVSIAFATNEQQQRTLEDLLMFLENYPQQVVVAIDEFQQIREYEGLNMEAVLRKHIQHLHNVRFIYCGSKKHTMADMFTNAKSPFYESTVFLSLEKLSETVYADFIKHQFERRGKSIGDEQVRYILEWTRDYTYYTQKVCNKVFEISAKQVRMEDVYSSISFILDSEKERFLEIRRLITRSQWKMLKAIASEGTVSQITSSAFLTKYGIPSSSAALRNIKALTEKELVLAEPSGQNVTYSVYNVFLSRYLEQM